MRSRRLTRDLDDLPGLFDDIDISRPDIAGEIIQKHSQHISTTEQDIVEIDESAIAPRKAIRFISFGSGSSGNCAYIGTNKGGLLIDAGVEGKYVTEQLLHNGIDTDAIKGIILTHDHSDHVKYAYPLLRRNRSMLLYCTPKTLNGLLRRHNISRRIKDYHHQVYKEFPFEVGDMTITPFEVSHDGTDNVGFAVSCGDLCFVVTTDTGYITERADFYMRQADALMIESNYDAEMLRNGTYPEYLKARIASQTGHLDNADTASYLASIASDRLRHIFLCHLSHDNNCPEIALAATSGALKNTGHTVTEDPRQKGIILTALPRFAASPLFILRKS